MLLIGLAAVCFVCYYYYGIDFKYLSERAERLDSFLVFLLITLLPMVGVPVTLLYALAGAKFGSYLGLIIVALATIFNLALTYWVTSRFFHDPIQAFFEKTKYSIPQIPKGEYVPVCLLSTVVPGIPYGIKNYMLVLAGVPFRPFLWVSFPVYTINASIAIFFGDFMENLTPGKITFLVVYGLFLLWLGRYVYMRLKRKRELKRFSETMEKKKA